MSYMPGLESGEHECWYINMGAVDKSFFTTDAVLSWRLTTMSKSRVIEGLAIIGATICMGCTSSSALQERCSGSDQAACDQVAHAQQDFAKRPDLSGSPVIAPMVQGP